MSEKRHELCMALVDALQEAPAEERANLRDALAAYREALRPAGSLHWAWPLPRDLLAAIEEGVDPSWV